MCMNHFEKQVKYHEYENRRKLLFLLFLNLSWSSNKVVLLLLLRYFSNFFLQPNLEWSSWTWERLYLPYGVGRRCCMKVRALGGKIFIFWLTLKEEHCRFSRLKYPYFPNLTIRRRPSYLPWSLLDTIFWLTLFPSPLLQFLYCWIGQWTCRHRHWEQ